MDRNRALLLFSWSFVFLSFCLPLSAQDLKDFSHRLEKVVQTAMKKHSVMGVQLTLFTPREFFEMSYGYADVDRKRKVTGKTVFQAGALVRPLSAYVAVDALSKVDPTRSLRQILSEAIPTELDNFKITNTGKTRINLHHLLSMTSGFPVSRLGLLSSGKTQYLKSELASQQSLDTQIEAGTLIQIAPQNYAYVSQLTEALTGKNFIKLTQQHLKSLGLTHTCVLAKHCESSLKDLSQPLTNAGSFHFQMSQIGFLFPTADSLFTNAREYAGFLSRLWKQSKKVPSSVEALLFTKHFSYDERLGGMGYGFSFSLPVHYEAKRKAKGGHSFRESVVFYVESSLPGYSALAFIHETGMGAVILINKDDLFFLRTIQNSLYRLYGIANEGKNALTSSHEWEVTDGVGSYRPLSAIPEGYRWLNFLNELQIRDTKEGLELSSVFEKEVILRLYPLSKDLYVARGLAKMDGWHVLLRRDVQGNVVALDTDMLRYERVSKIFSAWSILIALGILAGLPIFIPLFYFIWWRKD